MEKSFLLENLEIFGPKDSRQVIVFLHDGAGMDCSYFRPFLAPLEKEVQVYFYRQGFLRGFEIENLIEELKMVLALIPKEKKITILGHGFGGALAIDYLARIRTKRVNKLILVSWIYDHLWKDYSRYKNEILIRKIGVESILNPCFLDADVSFKYNYLSHSPLYFSDEFYERGRKVLSQVHYNGHLYSSIEFNYLRILNLNLAIKKIKIPTISIAGGCDSLVYSDYILKGCELNSMIKSFEMKKVGHFPFMEDPKRFIEIVFDFLK